MPKYMGNAEELGAKKPEPKPLDQMDKVNNALDKGLKIFEKIQTLVALKQGQQQTTSSPAQQVQAKTEKTVSQMEVVIDDEKAVNEIVALLNNMPEEIQEKKISEAVQEIEKNKSLIRGQVYNFIKGVTSIK